MREPSLFQLLPLEDQEGLTELEGLLLAWKASPPAGLALPFPDFFSDEITLKRLEKAIRANAGHSLFARYTESLMLPRLKDETLAAIVSVIQREDPVALFREIYVSRNNHHEGNECLPPYLVSMMSGIARELGASTLYFPSFADPYTLTAFKDRQGLFVDHPSARVLFWTAVVNAVFDAGITIHKGDCIESLTFIERAGHLPMRFDAAVVIPPFGNRIRVPAIDPAGRFFGLGPQQLCSGEAAYIMHARCHAPSVVVLVSNGFLFRGSGADARLREELINAGEVSAIIALPQKSLWNTSVAVSIMVLDKREPKDCVLFIDARMKGNEKQKQGELPSVDDVVGLLSGNGDILPVARVPVREIAMNDCILSIERYIGYYGEAPDPIPGESRKLSDIAEISRSQVLSDDASGAIEIAELRFSDIPEAGYTIAGSKVLKTDAGNRIFERYRLRPNDIVLAARGSIGEIIPVGIVGATTDRPLFPSQLLFTIRLRAETGAGDLAIALYRYLRSDIGQARLKMLLHGTAIPQLSASDIRNLSIPVPSLAETGEHRLAFEKEAALQKNVDKLRRQLTELRSSYFPQNI